MKRFEIQSIEIEAPYETAFSYIANPENLPLWTNAFQSVSGNQAVLRTPGGIEQVILRVDTSRLQGTIDWNMKFQDGSIAKAFSRLMEINDSYNIYSFVLLAPPVPLEALEGALQEQSAILKEELKRLKQILDQK